MLQVGNKNSCRHCKQRQQLIKKIPIPDVHTFSINDSEAYSKLVEIGKELSNGNTFVKTLSKNQLVKFYPELRND